MTDFWPRVWEAGRTLAESNELDERTATALRDPAVQRFVFGYKGFSDPAWFHQFRAAGLFKDPPGVQRHGDRMTAEGWPVMSYLTAAASEVPAEVADVLGSLVTDNWWVIASAIETAGSLPVPASEDAILHVLRQWHSSSVHWTDPEALVAVFERLAGQPDLSSLTEAVFRVMSRIWEVRGVGYDVSEVLTSATERLPSASHGSIADGIELAILHRVVTSTEWSGFGVSLSDLDRDMEDPLSELLTTWLRIANAETKRSGASGALQRCLRLLGSEHRIVKQMGLRALRIAFDRSPDDPAAHEVLEGLARQPIVLLYYDYEAEILPLFSSHWTRLSLETRASWIDALHRIGSADEDSTASRYAVRNWLGHLRRYVGDRELLLLQRLESELGPARTEFSGPRTSGSFIGPVGPLPQKEIAKLSAQDLLGLMRFVPGRGDDMFGPTPEGLGRQVQAEVARRPGEFLPVLNDVAESVPYASIVHSVTWGLNEAFKNEAERTPAARSAVLAFMSGAIERADAGRYESERYYGASQVVKGAAGLLEDLAAWMAEAPEHDELLKLLDRILSDPEPAPEFEARFGGENMDPPSLSLNTTRGRGVRAALALLSRSWNPGREGPLREGIETLLSAHVGRESSPSVFSSFGIYLPQLVAYWPGFWAEHAERLLPEGPENGQRWEAVFTTYLMFNGPNLRVVTELREHYRLATERANEAEYPFLRKHGSRLLVHLAAIGLPPQEGPEGWGELLRAAIAALPSDQVGRAAAEVAHAVRDGALEVSGDWLLHFVAVRLIARRGHALDRTEGRALADLTFVSRAPLVKSGGLLLDLTKRATALDGNRLLEYLREVDSPRTKLGAAVLDAGVRAKLYQGFIRSPELLLTSVKEYSTVDPTRSWTIVNLLGAAGVFDCEELARTLYESRLSERANADRDERGNSDTGSR